MSLIEAARGRLPAHLTSWYDDERWRFVLDLVLVAVTFLVLSRVVLVYTVLPLEAYFEASIAWQLIVHMNPVILLGGAIAFGGLLWFGALGDRWRELDDGSTLRVVIAALTVLIAWPLIAYPYNFYFDQAHGLDRALLLTLAVLVAWRPVFLIPFLLLAMPVLRQFQVVELGGSILAHKLQVIYPLMLFAAALCVHALSRRFPLRPFLFLLLVMVGAAYWEAALAKHALDWTFSNALHLILPAAYAHGWLGNVSPETIHQIAQNLEPFDTPLQIVVMVVEAGCLLIAFSRRLAITLLASLVVFHLGVLGYYGFFFWPWIALNLGVIALLIRIRPQIHSLSLGALGAGLIVVGTLWAHAPSLGWLDTRVTYTYQIHATDTAGREHELDPEYFGPYEDVFTMSAFSYLSSNALTRPYGVAHDIELARELRNEVSIGDVERLEASAPSTQNAERTARLEEFLKRFITQRTRTKNGTDTDRWRGRLNAPGQFLSTTPSSEHVPEQVKEIAVIEVVSIYGRAGPAIARERPVLQITLEADE